MCVIYFFSLGEYMRNIIIVAVLLVVIVMGILLCGASTDTEQLLRIHIRANSNDQCDQDVKYIVKQAVVDYLVPYIANCYSLDDALAVVASQLDNIEQIADDTLIDNGYSYTSTVCLCEELFPDRVYDDITIPSGVYDALIIELGSGTGDNWWCVVYPPLCFVGSYSSGDSIVYQSKLYEIIANWQDN